MQLTCKRGNNTITLKAFLQAQSMLSMYSHQSHGSTLVCPQFSSQCFQWMDQTPIYEGEIKGKKATFLYVPLQKEN